MNIITSVVGHYTIFIRKSCLLAWSLQLHLSYINLHKASHTLPGTSHMQAGMFGTSHIQAGMSQYTVGHPKSTLGRPTCILGCPIFKLGCPTLHVGCPSLHLGCPTCK